MFLFTSCSRFSRTASFIASNFSRPPVPPSFTDSSRNGIYRKYGVLRQPIVFSAPFENLLETTSHLTVLSSALALRSLQLLECSSGGSLVFRPDKCRSPLGMTPRLLRIPIYVVTQVDTLPNPSRESLSWFIPHWLSRKIAATQAFRASFFLIALLIGHEIFISWRQCEVSSAVISINVCRSVATAK